MMTTLYVPANTNEINPEFIRFMEEEPEMFERCKNYKDNKGLIRACMNYTPINPYGSRRSAANFIWFMKFEQKSIDNKTKKLSKPPTLNLVEGSYDNSIN